MPTVSVVMSVYNGEDFLGEAVDSVLAQTFADFEFIVIDDGSTDRTPEILSEYAKRDRRVRVFHRSNKGRAESLNHGIDLATGPLIARMDADDISLPHRLKEQFEFMDGHPEVGLLGSAVEFITRDRRSLGVSLQPAADDAGIRHAMGRANQFYHPTVMMRKAVVLAAGGYRKALVDADDYDLFLRMAERTQMACLARPVLLYRVHPGQASVGKMTQQSLCLLAARTAASLRSRGIPDPLWAVDEVTPKLVRSMGATDEEIRREAVMEHGEWMTLLATVDPDSALQVIDRLVALCNSGPGGQATAATALMQAASIQYRRRRFGTALACLGRGILARPATAVEHLRLALARRVSQLSSHASR